MNKISSRAMIIGPIIIFIVIVMMIVSMDRDSIDSMYQRESQIEGVIRQYAVACYAQEGAYPTSLDYLVDNYGLILDEEKYYYYYDLFASNLMPDIKVTSIERGDEKQ